MNWKRIHNEAQDQCGYGIINIQRDGEYVVISVQANEEEIEIQRPPWGGGSTEGVGSISFESSPDKWCTTITPMSIRRRVAVEAKLGSDTNDYSMSKTRSWIDPEAA